MAKKLKIYERFLLGLAFLADELIDFRREGREDYKLQGRFYFDPWGPPGYKPSSLRKTLDRMLKTGYIEKVVKKGKPYFRLTSRANKKLKRDFPIFKMQRKKWDGKWRIVIFDISEDLKYVRDSLRKKLKELGFGMLQKSIYISPYDFVQDMYEFLQAKKLLGKAFVLTAKHELMGNPRNLANLVWKVDKTQDAYDYLWQKIILIKERRNKEKAIKEIKNRYLQLILDDPCLPFELLPPDWMGEKVRRAVVGL